MRNTNSKIKTALVRSLLFFCSFALSLYCGLSLTCTSSVYNNFAGAIIRGPCPSSQVIASIGSTVMFECSFEGSGYIKLWNISSHLFITGFASPSPLNNTTISASQDLTVLTISVLSEQVLYIQCGLCNLISSCHPSNLQDTSMTLPVQFISFGK